MDLYAQFDIYCERLDPSFWAEPINALSNISFILAGLWAVYEARRRGANHIAVWLTSTLAFCIGIGSFLFHTFATGWANLADVVPIVLFVLTYAVAALALIGGASGARVVLYTFGMILFLAVVGYLTALSGISINGSEAYFPALATMLVITVMTFLRNHPALPWFLSATVAFVLSLTFRSIDMAVCDAWAYGTHQLWHLFNGLVIALLLQALIRNVPRTTS